MRWLVDECVAAGLVASMRDARHEVAYVAEISPRASDFDVLDRAWAEDRLLLTEDKDFGDLIFRQSRAVPGLVLLRLPSDDATQRWERLAAAVVQLGPRLFGRYTVIGGHRMRSRPLPARV